MRVQARFLGVLAESRRQRHAPAEHAPQEQPLKEHALQEGARPVEPTYTLWATSLLVFVWKSDFY